MTQRVSLRMSGKTRKQALKIITYGKMLELKILPTIQAVSTAKSF
jgi:hypothetical protein